MGRNDKGQFQTSVSVSGALGGQQQYFRVRPQDIQVVEGQVAELQCHIANLAGPVQWSKDGFVLGHNYAAARDSGPRVKRKLRALAR
ncbi:hypothetical protein IscW_ISCW022952 [Ixodes scapularis]|uniref:Ig-like domain-containing protein n=1 Tax=Ixodes scapularis TaxID=6945 RepID=B7QHG8_IXOSC|nr:hypothetical protein IscW_ISCW022952 [Ixodes scapularis]|eukprot:XP_002414625.1 hypothetical protein IscW_ISCW022952 [Ixodes scapularis]